MDHYVWNLNAVLYSYVHHQYMSCLQKCTFGPELHPGNYCFLTLPCLYFDTLTCLLSCFFFPVLGINIFLSYSIYEELMQVNCFFALFGCCFHPHRSPRLSLGTSLLPELTFNYTSQPSPCASVFIQTSSKKICIYGTFPTLQTSLQKE